MQKDFLHILFTQKDDVVTLTLNRPEVRNAFHYDMLVELEMAIGIAESSGAEILVIEGKGPVFCAGADINWFAGVRELDEKEKDQQLRALSNFLWKLYTTSLVTISVLKGSVMGGGIGIAAASDFVVGTPDTKMAFREVKLGITPALISPFVIEKIGTAKAKDLMLSGTFFNGQEAMKMGLFNKLTENSLIGDSLNGLIKELKSGGKEAKKNVKKLVSSLSSSTVTQQKLETALGFLKEALNSEEAKEGFLAFTEKRAPNWIKPEIVK